ncbi:adenine DNA glycosylase [Cyclospora cayetanensis]|uniref:Adenine DNA glycosylase n=1 Tax=Cyclospora cayetanensis TaxID=88456 RepID=A0A6P6S1D1_9EIME|nr:adenine DNA glycosylase [Cyclospora cayetanensis]
MTATATTPEVPTPLSEGLAGETTSSERALPLSPPPAAGAAPQGSPRTPLGVSRRSRMSAGKSLQATKKQKKEDVPPLSSTSTCDACNRLHAQRRDSTLAGTSHDKEKSGDETEGQEKPRTAASLPAAADNESTPLEELASAASLLPTGLVQDAPKEAAVEKAGEAHPRPQRRCSDFIRGRAVVGPPRSAYGTWVSEVMLQQTQVHTAIRYWKTWMARWPSISSLAQASVDEIYQVWRGLGYYRRQRRAASRGSEIFAGESWGRGMPKRVAAAGAAVTTAGVPGIGSYTAGAIASLAFGIRAPAVDGNVTRVFCRVLGLAAPSDSQEPGVWNEAAIELGATICLPRSPACSACPGYHPTPLTEYGLVASLWRPSLTAHSQQATGAYTYSSGAAAVAIAAVDATHFCAPECSLHCKH